MTVLRDGVTRCKAGAKTQVSQDFVEYAYTQSVCIESDEWYVELPNFATTAIEIFEAWVHVIDEEENILASEQILWGGLPGITNTDTGSDYAFRSDRFNVLDNLPRGTRFWFACYMSGVTEFGMPTTALLMEGQHDRYRQSNASFTTKVDNPLTMDVPTNPVITACRALVPNAFPCRCVELPPFSENWNDLVRPPAILEGADSRGGAVEDLDGDGESGLCRGLRENLVAYCTKAAGGSTGDSFGVWLDTDYGTHNLLLHDAVGDFFGVNSCGAGQPDTNAHGEAVFALKVANAALVASLHPDAAFICGTSWIPNNGTGADNAMRTGYGLTAMKRLNELCQTATQATIPNLMKFSDGTFGVFDDVTLLNGIPLAVITALRIFFPALFDEGASGDGIHLATAGHVVQGTAWNPFIIQWNIGGGDTPPVNPAGGSGGGASVNVVCKPKRGSKPANGPARLRCAIQAARRVPGR